MSYSSLYHQCHAKRLVYNSHAVNTAEIFVELMWMAETVLYVYFFYMNLSELTTKKGQNNGRQS